MYLSQYDVIIYNHQICGHSIVYVLYIYIIFILFNPRSPESSQYMITYGRQKRVEYTNEIVH